MRTKSEYFSGPVPLAIAHAAMSLFHFRPDGMDWRAASRSRSRVSVMDWRPQSRSRSRTAFGRRPYDYASEEHSQALLAHGSDMWEHSDNLTDYVNSYPGDAGQWHLGTTLSALTEEGGQVNNSQSQIRPTSQEGEAFGLGGTHNKSPTIGYEDALRAATAASELDRTKQDNNFEEGRVDANQRYQALPGISGPGLVDRSEENFHPQYGYLPRRVRKTSFDHTVGPGHEKGMLPPPMPAKVSRMIPV